MLVAHCGEAGLDRGRDLQLGFGTADWDLQRLWASERAMIMRNQGFIHPATLVPEELEYNKGYEARIKNLKSKFEDLT